MTAREKGSRAREREETAAISGATGLHVQKHDLLWCTTHSGTQFQLTYKVGASAFMLTGLLADYDRGKVIAAVKRHLATNPKP